MWRNASHFIRYFSLICLYLIFPLPNSSEVFKQLLDFKSVDLKSLISCKWMVIFYAKNSNIKKRKPALKLFSHGNARYFWMTVKIDWHGCELWISYDVQLYMTAKVSFRHFPAECWQSKAIKTRITRMHRTFTMHRVIGFRKKTERERNDSDNAWNS